MPELSERQLSGVRSLIEAVPDHAVRSLDRMLEGGGGAGGMAAVRALVSAEIAEREACLILFSPLMPLCVAQSAADGRPRFPPRSLSLVWRALERRNPEFLRSIWAVRDHWGEEPAPIEPLDLACVEAAAGLRQGPDGDFAEAAAFLDRARPGGADAFAAYLDLVPLARALLPRLSDWLGRMTGERAAAARLAYKDAVSVAEDAGPRLFEIMYAHLQPPWLILRIVSAVMDRPGDRYMADSELGLFGQRILDDVDRRLDAINRFDPSGGVAAGRAAGEALLVATGAIGEFENTLDLGRDGPWAQRIRKVKAALAKAAEHRLREVDDAVAAALPLQSGHFGVRLVRGSPRLSEEPDPRSKARALGLLTFYDLARASADQGGYGVARAKAAEKVNSRLDQYVEDLLERLRDEEAEDHPRVRAYLDVAAELVGAASGDKAAQIVRRRISAA